MIRVLFGRLVIPAIVVGVCALTTTVKADTLQANIGDVISSVSTTGVNGSANSGTWPVIYGYLPNSGSVGVGGIYAGQIDWAGTDASNSVGAQQFFGYCTQITTDVYVPSSTGNYTVTLLQNSADTNLAGDALQRAICLEAMVGNLPAGAFDGLATPGNPASFSPAIAAAVQVATWELVYNGLNDAVTGTGFNLTNAASGKFSLATGDAFTNSVITLATGYLDAILTGGPGTYGGFNDASNYAPVAGLTNSPAPGSGSQNQVVMLFSADDVNPGDNGGSAAPLPAVATVVPMLLAACGLPRAMGRRRKMA